jgi:hypothetical protein
VTGEWYGRLTEGSALGGRVQVPGREWRTGPRSGSGEPRRIPRALYKGPTIPLRSSPLLRPHASSVLFFPPTDGPLLSAPSPCSSAYGRGREEFRLGPGGSELADLARRRIWPPSLTPRSGLGANHSMRVALMVLWFYSFVFSVLVKFLIIVTRNTLPLSRSTAVPE